MSKIAINTQRVDETVHHISLNEQQLKALILSAVSEAAGVEVDNVAVKVRRFDLTSRMGSIGTEYGATVTIVVDHAASR